MRLSLILLMIITIILFIVVYEEEDKIVECNIALKHAAI